MTQALLRGIRVLDLSQYIPGPFATRQLADLGADVIKVEPPQGDPMRSFLYAGEGVSPLYQHLNRGKRVVQLDLKSTEGKATLGTLLAEADVLLESFRPGVMARLGFGREALKALNPGLVHCALSGFGQTGPYRDRAGHDITYCAVAGALTASGGEDGLAMPYPPLADHAGAMQAVNAILAALLGRARGNSSQGVFLDISLCESALSWQYLSLLAGEDGYGQFMLNGGLACYRIYHTADGRRVALGALEDKFWQAFCDSVGRSDWVERRHEAAPQTALTAELSALFAAQPLAHWIRVLGGVDCCFEPVPLSAEIAQHPQMQERQMLDGNEPLYAGWLEGCPPEQGRAVQFVEAAAW